MEMRNLPWSGKAPEELKEEMNQLESRGERTAEYQTITREFMHCLVLE